MRVAAVPQTAHAELKPRQHGPAGLGYSLGYNPDFAIDVEESSDTRSASFWAGLGQVITPTVSKTFIPTQQRQFDGNSSSEGMTDADLKLVDEPAKNLDNARLWDGIVKFYQTITTMDNDAAKRIAP